jgi:hypothetical protein
LEPGGEFDFAEVLEPLEIGCCFEVDPEELDPELDPAGGTFLEIIF